MSVISMKQLLEAGVHFGHQTRRWNPKMAPYIYTERNGIYIIDLQKSVGKVDEAYKAVSDIAAEGGTILFVGTKKQAQDAIKTEAERCGMFYVNERWLGGMLTNFKTIQSRIARLKADRDNGRGRYIRCTAEEGSYRTEERVGEAREEPWRYQGDEEAPGCNLRCRPEEGENLCSGSSYIWELPLIGIADTNCDPEELDYVIPGNDDAIRAVKLIVSKMADAVIEANQGAEMTAEEAESAEADAAEEA